MERLTGAVRAERFCYQKLLKLLHPHGLACPKCGCRRGWRLHRRRRAPVVDYRCHCGCVFNAWTETVLSNTHLPPSVLWQLVQAIRNRRRLAEVVRGTGRSRSSLSLWHRRLRQFLQKSLSKPGSEG